MTPTPQLELHPDADSLNAFVEQALAGSEREQVQAHLAACSRCRQVIYLAQEAAEAAATTWAPAAQAARRSGPWSRNWRWMWIPATAMAAALALVVVFYPRQTTSAPEMANVAPQSEEGAPRRRAPEPPVAEVTHTQAPAASAKTTSGRPNLPASRAAAGESTTEAAPSAQFPAAPNAFTFQTEVSNEKVAPLGSSVAGLAPQPARAQFKPEPAAPSSQTDLQLTGEVVSGNVAPAHTSAAGFRGAAVHGQAYAIQHPLSSEGFVNVLDLDSWRESGIVGFGLYSDLIDCGHNLL